MLYKLKSFIASQKFLDKRVYVEWVELGVVPKGWKNQGKLYVAESVSKITRSCYCYRCCFQRGWREINLSSCPPSLRSLGSRNLSYFHGALLIFTLPWCWPRSWPSCFLYGTVIGQCTAVSGSCLSAAPECKKQRRIWRQVSRKAKA